MILVIFSRCFQCSWKHLEKILEKFGKLYLMLLPISNLDITMGLQKEIMASCRAKNRSRLDFLLKTVKNWPNAFGLLDTTVQNSVHIPLRFQNTIMNLLKQISKEGKSCPNLSPPKFLSRNRIWIGELIYALRIFLAKLGETWFLLVITCTLFFHNANLLFA